MVGQMLVAHCVWVRFPSFNQNTRMAELAYAVVLEAIQLKVRVFLRVQIFGKVNYLSYIYFIRLIGNKDSPLNRVSANLINCHSVSKANHKSKCPRTHLLLSLNAQFD